MEAIILRFDAPLMSFGGVIVDQHNITDRFPAESLLAGMLANALGWSHADHGKIGALQNRLVTASRWDVEPALVIDYHTVDFSQPKMREPGWTTRGCPEHRHGGPSAKFGTHQRYRHYWANGILTAAVGLRNHAAPDLNILVDALLVPARPLFIGRKTCLPATSVFLKVAAGADILAILAAVPRAECPVRRCESGMPMPARWPAEVGRHREEQLKTLYDQRDWLNQWHAGSRMVAEGPLEEVGYAHG